MRLVMQTDGAEMKATEAIRLSRVSKSSAVIVRKNTFVVDTMNTLINNADA